MTGNTGTPDELDSIDPGDLPSITPEDVANITPGDIIDDDEVARITRDVADTIVTPDDPADPSWARGQPVETEPLADPITLEGNWDDIDTDPAPRPGRL